MVTAAVCRDGLCHRRLLQGRRIGAAQLFIPLFFIHLRVGDPKELIERRLVALEQDPPATAQCYVWANVGEATEQAVARQFPGGRVGQARFRAGSRQGRNARRAPGLHVRRLSPDRGPAGGVVTVERRHQARGRGLLEGVRERDQRRLAPCRAEEGKAYRKAGHISCHYADRGVPGHRRWR